MALYRSAIIHVGLGLSVIPIRVRNITTFWHISLFSVYVTADVPVTLNSPPVYQ